MNNTINIGIKENILLIRAEGAMRAGDSFTLSEFLKPYLEKTEKELRILLDLGSCTYMDSTFIGFILSLESKCHLYNPDCVKVLNPTDKVKRGLKGLSCLDKLHIEENATVPDITTFKLDPGSQDFGNRKNIEIVFDAHRRLSEISEENREEFKDLLAELKSVLEMKKD